MFADNFVSCPLSIGIFLNLTMNVQKVCYTCFSTDDIIAKQGRSLRKPSPPTVGISFGKWQPLVHSNSTEGNGPSIGNLLQRWSTQDRTFFCEKNTSRVQRFIVKYRQYNSLWITRNATSCHREMVPIVLRRLHRLNSFGKGSNRTIPIWCPLTFIWQGNWKSIWVADTFSNDGQVQTTILSYPRGRGAIFCRQGIELLVEWSDKCLQRLGDCVAK